MMSSEFSAMAAMLASEFPVGRSTAQPTLAAPLPPTHANGRFDPQQIIAFWTAAGPSMWFAKDPAFDRTFRDRFITDHEAAARGDLAGWAASPQGALALLLLLDQFPRNAFRGTARMYATDPMARDVAATAITAGHDLSVDPALALFFYLPFAHSENLNDQDRSVTLCRRLAPPNPAHAERHRDIIRRFGRFPHRNAILGRVTTPEEADYLNSGGYSG